MVRVGMAKAAVMRVMVMVACLAFLVPDTEGDSPLCQKFADEKLKDGESKNYWCPTDQCPERTGKSGKVVGSGVYFGGSDICLAALHAGVVTRLGTTVTITRLRKKVQEVFGTSQNRIVSQAKRRPRPSPNFIVENPEQQEGAVGELLMVHNGGFGSTTRFTCLSQDQESPISVNNLRSWDYKPYIKSNLATTSGNNSPKLFFELKKEDNPHAVRLLGSQSNEDVLAVVQYPEAQYQSKVATVRASVGEEVTITLLKKTGFSNEVHLQRLPDDWSSKSLRLPVKILAMPNKTGIYIFHKENNDDGYLHGAYLDVVIRACRAGYSGPRCAKQCPQCLNGGQCHSQLGTCVCAPGFNGDTCQYACQPGWVGNKCQFRCSQDFRGTQKDQKEEQEGSCRGLTICQPHPYGCSCAAGFLHPSQPGHTCSRGCSKGYYGADCEQQCQNCAANECDPYSGTCRQGCQSGFNCRKGVALSAVNFTSLHRGFSASWDAFYNKDTQYFLSYELLRHSSCPDASPQRPHQIQHLLTTPLYSATTLLRHAAYYVCVVASSSMGLSQPQCSTVNTLPEVPTVNITLLACNENGKKLNCFVNVSGGCKDYNGPNVTVTFILLSELACIHPLTSLQRFTNLSTTGAKVSFPNYVHGEMYQVIASVGNSVGPGHKRSFSFFTEPRAPPPIENVTHISLSDSAVQLRWNDPCPSNGKIQKWRITSYGSNGTKWLELPPCDTTDVFHRCYNITGLMLGSVYSYKIEQQNDGGSDTGYNYTFMLEEKGAKTDSGMTEEGPFDPLLLLLLLLFIFPIFGLLAYLWHHTPLASREVDQETFANHELQDTTPAVKPSVAITEDKIEDEAIYENLQPQAFPPTASQVPYTEVEAYLNRVIGSREAGEDFRTVPQTLTKSMMVAQHPENKAKNRYKNNLPYDDTRVVLSRIDGNPSSDYINANHVQGYGNMRYIAAQGPKNAKVCTIADFWRMVVEQHINVIIMVANFVEMGKRKVGEYFIPGETLNFNDFEVVVKCMEQLPHFTVSSLLVKWRKEVHQVQHYHYQKWPDHGIPSEANSIAQMLIHFQSHHSEGGTIVHCSAGIGRTGTVLQVLLMCEMLNLKSYLSPLEALARLRISRARLVENEAQYNLSLEIFEEILFGNKTVVSTDYLLNHLDECILTSRTQYAKAKALPSPLTYTTSNLPVFHPLNRNKAVLPPDSSRVYLQPKAEVETGLSQYINAVCVPGLNKQEYILATEHPLPDTVASFWRLVVETECTLVVFINSLENHEESEFPTMLRESGEVWQVGDYQLQVKQTEPYGTWLRHFTLTITSNRDGIHCVDVYQSIQWPLCSSLPPSSLLLLTVAELLQVPRSTKVAPPLLCCGDGVTGCGLVAGMALIIEYLQKEQVVDVYRMVVKLQRARQQFIVSEEQFSMLYTGVAVYLQEFSSYGNFH